MKKNVGDKQARLPCRGCTRACRNYERCDGRPWQLAVDDIVSSAKTDKTAQG